MFDKVGYKDMIFTLHGFFGCLAVAINFHTFFYNDVIIADHLKKVYNYEPW